MQNHKARAVDIGNIGGSGSEPGTLFLLGSGRAGPCEKEVRQRVLNRKQKKNWKKAVFKPMDFRSWALSLRQCRFLCMYLNKVCIKCDCNLSLKIV